VTHGPTRSAAARLPAALLLLACACGAAAHNPDSPRDGGEVPPFARKRVDMVNGHSAHEVRRVETSPLRARERAPARD
jgi:hypothetical protein